MPPVPRGYNDPNVIGFGGGHVLGGMWGLPGDEGSSHPLAGSNQWPPNMPASPGLLGNGSSAGGSYGDNTGVRTGMRGRQGQGQGQGWTDMQPYGAPGLPAGPVPTQARGRAQNLQQWRGNLQQQLHSIGGMPPYQHNDSNWQ